MKNKTTLIGLAIGVIVLVILVFVGYRGSGYIQIDAGGFEADLSLRGPGGAKTISASDGAPQDIRTGTYKPERVVVRLTKASDQWWSILCRRAPWGELARIKVAKGKTTVLRMGPPLAMRTDATRNKQTVSIGLSLVGRAGEHYSPQVLTHNGPLPAPTLRIVDEAGEVLTAGKFKYG